MPSASSFDHPPGRPESEAAGLFVVGPRHLEQRVSLVVGPADGITERGGAHTLRRQAGTSTKSNRERTAISPPSMVSKGAISDVFTPNTASDSR